MRDRTEIWCEAADLSIGEIDRRASLAYERNGAVNLAFMSLDLHAELTKSLAVTSRHSNIGPAMGPSPQAVVRIMCTVGELHIQKVGKFRNFLLVGTKEDFDAFIAEGVDPIFWNDQERVRIDQAFEDLIILEGNNEEV